MNETTTQLLLLGATFVVVGYVIWRSAAMSRNSRRRDAQQEAKAELTARSRTPQSLVSALEVRLYEYGREVEGRVETTLKLLDRLVAEAETEIEQLESLLKQTEQNRTKDASADFLKPADVLKLGVDHSSRIPQFVEAGMSVPEIARALQLSEDEVRRVIAQDERKAA